GIDKVSGLSNSITGAASNGTHTVDLSSFQDGTVTVAISATDTAGNHATGTGDSTTLDTSADLSPLMTVSFDGTNAAVAGDVNAAHATAASYTVAGVDADATATVTFTGIDKVSGQSNSITGAASNGTHTIDLSSFQDGTVTVAISATDTAGNHATGTGGSTTLDPSADLGPLMTVSFDGTNAAVAGDVNAAHATAASYTVAGVDADATATVTFTGIDKVSGQSNSITGAASNGTHTIDLSSFQDGTVTVAISATDTAGNHATGTGGSTTLDTSADLGPPMTVSFAGTNAAGAGD